MQPHPWINFEIRKCYQYESRFDGVYSRNNLSKIKDVGVCDQSWWVQINRKSLDSLYLKASHDVIYFDSLGV